MAEFLIRLGTAVLMVVFGVGIAVVFAVLTAAMAKAMGQAEFLRASLAEFTRGHSYSDRGY